MKQYFQKKYLRQLETDSRQSQQSEKSVVYAYIQQKQLYTFYYN